MSKHRSSPELIGRADDLEVLLAALERSEETGFGAVRIGGEAGIGKTRLLSELERVARERGARVLTGECVELAEGELPFAPLVAALRPLTRELAPGELASLPGAEELGRLLPEFGDGGSEWINRDSALDETLSQSRLFEVLLALFARLGEAGPVVLAIEDLHWADRSTRDFLAFLIRNARDARLLLVFTYRTDELHRAHPLRPFLAELDRRASVERIELEPLSRGELSRLLEGILGEPPGEPLLASLFERSDGNPFFAEELLAASASRGAIPETLRDALLLRVEPLSPGARALLQVAATARRPVSYRLLETIWEAPEAELEQALGEALAASILVEDGDAFSFRHALVREAVVADLLPGQRTRLHVAFAEALGADPTLAGGSAGAAAAELAHHWWGARRLPEALSASVAAAEAAEAAFAFAEAHRHLERALEIWDQVEDAEQRAGADQAGLLARAAENASMILEPGRSSALVSRAIELVDEEESPVRSALLRERLGRYLWVGGDNDGALRSYRDAVELMPSEPPSPELARVLAAHGQILMLRGQPTESRRECERAIEVARSVGARAEEGHALNTLGVNISSLGDRPRGIECLLEAKRIAEELGWIDEIGRTYVNLTEEVDLDGRLAEAIALTQEGAEAMRRLGARSYFVFLETEASLRLVRHGRIAEAEVTLTRVRDSGPSGIGASLCGAVEASIALARGDFEAAAAGVRLAKQGLGPTRDSMFYAPAAAAEVELALLAEGAEAAIARFEEALAVIDAEVEYSFATAPLYWLGIRAYADVAERERAAGREAELSALERGAAASIARFDAALAPERYPEGAPAAEVLAYRALVDAEAARLAGAWQPGAWLAAAEAFDELALPLQVAYARLREAEGRLHSDGSRAALGELLAAAAAAAREAGATRLLDQAEALARRARIPLEGAPAAAPGSAARPAERLGLTDRELEVLELVAEGRTNREIGETLFISEKTASVHVSRILRKLEVRGRVEAATKAHRLGIVSAARS